MNGVLGLGSGQASSLNNDLIEKLKAIDNKNYLDPIDKKIDKLPLEREEIGNINLKVEELLSSIKNLSANNSNGVNVFDSKEADINGESVKFDVDSLQNIRNGSTTVEVLSLAQKDVFQTNKFTNENDIIGGGVINVSLGNNQEKSFNTINMTYKQLADKLNEMGLSTSIENTSRNNNQNEYRIIIKSPESGLENKINFSGDTSTLGLDLESNNVLKAKDSLIKVDGVEYLNSSNNLIVNGLKINAIKEGISTIDIKEDSNSIIEEMKNFTKKYNELNELLNKGIYDQSSNIEDKSSLRNISSILKEQLFGNGNSNISIFSIGFSLNEKSGNLEFNEKEFEKVLSTDKDKIKDLFVGVPENKGIGTLLDETISISGVTKSLLDYDINMLTRETKLKQEKEETSKMIENKYSQLAIQFAAYGVMINQMEMSFSGLKSIIQETYKSN